MKFLIKNTILPWKHAWVNICLQSECLLSDLPIICDCLFLSSQSVPKSLLMLVFLQKMPNNAVVSQFTWAQFDGGRGGSDGGLEAGLETLF